MSKRKNKNKGRQKAVQAHRLAPIAEQALTNFSNKTKDWLASYADMDKDAEKRPMANDFDRSARSEYDEFEKELDDEEDDETRMMSLRPSETRCIELVPLRWAGDILPRRCRRGAMKRISAQANER